MKRLNLEEVTCYGCGREKQKKYSVDAGDGAFLCFYCHHFYYTVTEDGEIIRD